MKYTAAPSQEDIELFKSLLDKYRYDFTKLVYIIFPFGQKGTPLEHKDLYDWQKEELAKLSKHLMNPETRYETYRLIVSSGNGAAKTALGALINLMLLYTQRLRCRVTANTDPQMNSVVWPEYDKWFRLARFNEHFFEKFGKSIRAKNAEDADTWRIDNFTWSEETPSAVSGLHNEGHAVCYTFEEAPGIPAVIWQYAAGAFTERNTIKLWLAFGNSDDPESKFEQNMSSPIWNSRRIDTRTLKHIDPKQIADWLTEAGGDEDSDDFRVRVRGLPRKTAKDSIIKLENVKGAIERREGFEMEKVAGLPAILGCDPAWRGGDETCIWLRQGHYSKLLAKYKLDKALGEDHMLTFQKLCHYEKTYRVDAVFIDQGEGTGIWTLANNSGRSHWELVSFAGSPNDTPETKDSKYGNIRAQMYYEAEEWIRKGGIIDADDPQWFESIEKELCWTKGTRHKITLKKLAEPKLDIKERVGKSPDVADGFVLLFARSVPERLEQNSFGDGQQLLTGQTPYKMPEHELPYEDIVDVEFRSLYD